MSLLSTEIRTRESKNSIEKSRLVVNLDFSSLLEEAGLISFSDFFHYAGGEPIKRIPDRTVSRITLGHGGSFFLKRHLLDIQQLWPRFSFGRGGDESIVSEGAREFNNYCLFRLRGLATAIPVAMGEREVEGAGMESFLLTRDFSPLVSLESVIRNSPQLLAGGENKERRRQLLFASANYARRMHQNRLNHLDFNATHILLAAISGQAVNPQLAVFDLQRVATNVLSSWRWPIKSLAELNFTLPSELFDEDERLFMLATYLGKEKLTLPDLLLWRAICAKTKKIGRHTIKRRARRQRQQEKEDRTKDGFKHLLIHDQDLGTVEPVSLERLLRQVPGRREVWAGRWRSRQVIVKTFQSGRRRCHVTREWQGLLTLHQQGIPAPQPLFRGEDASGHQVLVVERIARAVSMTELLRIARFGHERSRVYSLLMQTLALQHQKGVDQKDLHPGNFLLQEERVFSIDPAEMRFSKEPLGKTRSLARLAEMGALLPEFGQDDFKRLALEYAKARLWQLSTQTLNRLETKRREVIATKLKQRLKKYGRSNTRHAEVIGKHYRLLIDRQTGWECRAPEELAAVLREAFLGLPAGQTGQPFVFVWGTQQLTAYRFVERSLVKRLWKGLFSGSKQALLFWQELYRQQSTTGLGGTPIGLLQPLSSWPKLASFVITQTANKSALQK